MDCICCKAGSGWAPCVAPSTPWLGSRRAAGLDHVGKRHASPGPNTIARNRRIWSGDAFESELIAAIPPNSHQSDIHGSSALASVALTCHPGHVELRLWITSYLKNNDFLIFIFKQNALSWWLPCTVSWCVQTSICLGAVPNPSDGSLGNNSRCSSADMSSTGLGHQPMDGPVGNERSGCRAVHSVG